MKFPTPEIEYLLLEWRFDVVGDDSTACIGGDGVKNAFKLVAEIYFSRELSCTEAPTENERCCSCPSFRSLLAFISLFLPFSESTT